MKNSKRLTPRVIQKVRNAVRAFIGETTVATSHVGGTDVVEELSRHAGTPGDRQRQRPCCRGRSQRSERSSPRMGGQVGAPNGPKLALSIIYTPGSCDHEAVITILPLGEYVRCPS